jgi:hypothetical protein
MRNKNAYIRFSRERRRNADQLKKMMDKLFRKEAASKEEVDDWDYDDGDTCYYYHDAIGLAFLNILKFYVNIKKMSVCVLPFNIKCRELPFAGANHLPS